MITKTDLSVLVTGANGFLGAHVVRELGAFGITFPTDIRAVGSAERYLSIDITELSAVRSKFPSVDVIIHVAGLAHVFNPSEDAEELFDKVNCQGTRNLFEVAADKGVKHAVLISSVSVYKKKQGFVAEDDYLEPLSAYARSKMAAEKAAIEIAQKSGMRLTILRLATLYGPGDPGNVGRLIRQIASGRFIMPGSGHNYKSLLHVRDAARACRCAIENQREKIEIFNISDQPRHMLEIVNTIRSGLGKPPLRFRVPVFLFLAMAKLTSRLPIIGKKIGRLADTLEKFTTDDAYSAEKITRKLGFSCREDFAAGINEEIAEMQLKA